MSADQVQVTVRQAREDDADRIAALLEEVAAWLRQRGMPMWKGDELTLETVSADVSAGQFFVVEHGGEVAAAVKFQLEDPAFWPDVPGGDAAYVHRLVVGRAYAGRGLAEVLLRWAAERARGLGRRYLRLDCEASRAKLRALYEGFGFRHHSYRQVGPYYVARYEYPLAEDAAAVG
jgi:ribosomal protein S18 acetylase RimI-like enzyme